MRLKWWTDGGESPPPSVTALSGEYMDGYRAGFIDAEKAAARRTRGPNLSRPGHSPISVAEIVDRLRVTDETETEGVA